MANPEDAIAWYEKGHGLTVSGRYGEAVRAFDKAIAVKKNFAEAFFGRAVCHIKLGDSKKADDDILAAARLGNKEARLLLAERQAEEKKRKNRCIRCNAMMLDASMCWNCGMTYADCLPSSGEAKPDCPPAGTPADKGLESEGELLLEDAASNGQPIRVLKFNLTPVHLVAHTEGSIVKGQTGQTVVRSIHLKLDWIKEISIAGAQPLLMSLFSRKGIRNVTLRLHGSFPLLERGAYTDVREITGVSKDPASIRRWEYLAGIVGTSAPLCPICRTKDMVFLKARCRREGEEAMNSLLSCRSCRKRFIYDFDMGEYEHVGMNF
jgi:hypothetical protein